MSNISISEVPVDYFKVDTTIYRDFSQENRTYLFKTLDEMISFISGEIATDISGNIKRLGYSEVVTNSAIDLDVDKLMDMVNEENMEK